MPDAVETPIARILRVGWERMRARRAVETIQTHCVIAECDADGNGVWFDARTGTRQGDVLVALIYLSARDLLDRHPEHGGWVRCWESC